jgi:hypothetical protein
MYEVRTDDGEWSRARVLGAAMGLGGVALAGGLAGRGPLAAPAVEAAPRKRKRPGQAWIDYNGPLDQQLLSARGGEPFAEVVRDGATPRLGSARISDLEVALTASSLSKATIAWINETLAGKGGLRSGGASWLNVNTNQQIRRVFKNARIAGIVFGSLDGASLAALDIAMTIRPAETGLERITLAAPPKPLQKAKAILSSQFRVVIDGVDATVVRKVDAFGYGPAVPGTNAAPVVSDLEMTISEAGIATWEQWFAEFVRNRDGKLRNGRLELLDATAANVLLTVKLTGIGLHSLELAPFESTADAIRRATARMFVQGMELV